METPFGGPLGHAGINAVDELPERWIKTIARVRQIDLHAVRQQHLQSRQSLRYYFFFILRQLYGRVGQ